MSLYKTCVGSLASENASQLEAMLRVGKNVEELQDEVNQNFWHQRQSVIDEERLEVAMYNHGMKRLNKSGSVKAIVVDEAMQRILFFACDNANKAGGFGLCWRNMGEIWRQEEAAEPVIKFRNIENYKSKNFAFLKFNFTLPHVMRSDKSWWIKHLMRPVVKYFKTILTLIIFLLIKYHNRKKCRLLIF